MRLLCLAALLLAGCDSSADSAAVLIPLARIGVDLTPTPDGASRSVFFEVQSATGDAYYRTGIQTDASTRVSTDVAAPFRVPSSTVVLYVAVFDFGGDLATSTRLARSEPFTATQVAATERTEIGATVGEARFTLTRSVFPQ